MKEIVERIKIIMQKEGLSPAEFADELNIGRPLLSHVLGGRNNPSLQLVLKILQSYPSYTANWLVLGQEDDYKVLSESVIHAKPDEIEQKIAKSSTVSGLTANQSMKALLFYADGTFDEFNPRK